MEVLTTQTREVTSIQGISGDFNVAISYENKQGVINGLTIDINIGQLLTAIEHEILSIFESFNTES